MQQLRRQTRCEGLGKFDDTTANNEIFATGFVCNVNVSDLHPSPSVTVTIAPRERSSLTTLQASLLLLLLLLLLADQRVVSPQIVA